MSARGADGGAAQLSRVTGPGERRSWLVVGEPPPPPSPSSPCLTAQICIRAAALSLATKHAAKKFHEAGQQ